MKFQTSNFVSMFVCTLYNVHDVMYNTRNLYYTELYRDVWIDIVHKNSHYLFTN